MLCGSSCVRLTEVDVQTRKPQSLVCCGNDAAQPSCPNSTPAAEAVPYALHCNATGSVRQKCNRRVNVLQHTNSKPSTRCTAWSATRSTFFKSLSLEAWQTEYLEAVVCQPRWYGWCCSAACALLLTHSTQRVTLAAPESLLHPAHTHRLQHLWAAALLGCRRCVQDGVCTCVVNHRHLQMQGSSRTGAEAGTRRAGC